MGTNIPDVYQRITNWIQQGQHNP